MKTTNEIVGLPVKVVRDLMQHFRKYAISEETTREFFDTLHWRKAVDDAVKIDSQLRRILRSRNSYQSRKGVAKRWGVRFKAMPKNEAKAILDSLLQGGWIEPNEKYDGHFDHNRFVVTDKGNQLSVKRLVSRINRDKADRIVRDMIERIEAINLNPSLLNYVTKVIAFGSYVTDSDDLGDIDLYVQLTRRTADNKEHERARKAFNEVSGKQFHNLIEELFYPEIYVRQLIKNRSPYISLHDKDDLELTTMTKTLYEFSPNSS